MSSEILQVSHEREADSKAVRTLYSRLDMCYDQNNTIVGYGLHPTRIMRHSNALGLHFADAVQQGAV